MLFFVLQLRKQKKNFTEAKLTERSALVNLLHGLLLGLYPYNTKHCEYDDRVTIVGAIHKLFMQASPLEFILQHDSLFTLAMIEYLSNVVNDFWPVECNFLIKSAISRSNINQLCESFRGNISKFVSQSNMWQCFEENAASVLPAIHRQLKINNHKLDKIGIVSRVPAAIATILQNHDFLNKILNLPIIRPNTLNMISQIKILCGNSTFQELQAIEFFWNKFKISYLPIQTAQKQRQTLKKFNSCDTFCSTSSKLFVCIHCCLKNVPVSNQKFAYNCVTSNLICTCCGQSINFIEMIGKFFTLYNNTYYLCTSCLRPTIYSGNSFDICQNCEKQPKERSMTFCYFCHKKTHEITHKVLNVQSLTIEYIPLCFNHAKTCITSCSTTYDINSLEKEFGSKVAR